MALVVAFRSRRAEAEGRLADHRRVPRQERSLLGPVVLGHGNGGVGHGPRNGELGDDHEWTEGEEWEKFVAQYEHPLIKRVGELAKTMGGHGGMDFLMLYRMVECLQKGLPLDQNVYEGVFWSSVGPLSEKSVREDGAPQDFPDFTRGHWKTTKPLGIVE